MKRLSSFTVIVSFACLALVGLALLPLLPVKLNPSRTLPGFTVSYAVPNTSARVVEMEVTSKLEAMLARINGVKKIESSSDNGSGSIQVELDKHVDVDAARFEASTVIRQTWPQLPDGMSYPIITMQVTDEENARPFMIYTLNASVPPIEIQRYAEENISPRLAQLNGVYRIALSGATPMEWQLQYDSRQLQSLGITIDDITTAIQRHSERAFLGTHNMNDQDNQGWIRLMVMPEQDESSFNPADIVVKPGDGKLIRLSQLVKVSHVEAAPQSYYRINGLNSIYLTITANESVNQLELNKAVKAEMAEVLRQLPNGFEVHASYDATDYIRKELNKIYYRTTLTVLILLLFVWLISRRLKYLFLIMVSLAVNIAVALIFYYLFGLEMQLFSLAGVTISLNLVIDSTIVMADHYMHRHNLQAFLSVLAATLTTMGALVIIFFLNDNIRLNLQDFAAVVIINLAVSLLVSLFFVPALINRMRIKNEELRIKNGELSIIHFQLAFTQFYENSVRQLARLRWMVGILLIAGFAYGLYIFINKVYNGSYFTRNDEVVLYANANLPNGSTLEQMNTLIQRMEVFLSGFQEIKQFQTTIYNANRANISVYFKDSYAHTGFPYQLKSRMTTQALQLGGGSWSIYGLADQGFSNDVRETSGSYRIRMYGYNYDELYEWAEKLKAKLLEHRRIQRVDITSEFSYWKGDYQEFYINLDRERMMKAGVTPSQLFATLRPVFGRDMVVSSVSTPDGMERIKLTSQQSKEYDIWALNNGHFLEQRAQSQARLSYAESRQDWSEAQSSIVNRQSFKLSDLASIEKGQQPQRVVKENQQYRLCLQYEYVGATEMGKRVQERELEAFTPLLPMGYTAEKVDYFSSWSSKDNRQYLLLLVVVAIIFFITGILFNSWKQPLAIIFVIPVSYIGVFLTFYWFHLNFDQGGFASFVLLCGITVNASIYIINEYNNIRKRFPRLSSARAYVKAWNAKVVPIFLTVVSTILGFIPFMVGTSKEAFWFPLAAGTTGGLVMSVIAIFCFLPAFVVKRK
ncbi:MAG: efflux RND transporter permease subunit [Bacteroidaceae bacterium]|nr:efflux RND transporter permease subunit [Bacteroidaceae bacterium]